MAVGGPDHVVGPQVLLDGLRLGGRLDHDQRLRHVRFVPLYDNYHTGYRLLGAGRYHRLVTTPGRPARGRLVRSGRSRWSTGGFPLLAVFTQTLQRLIADNGYLAVFLLMLLGSICIPIPSEVVMAFAGALCAPAFAASVLGTP